VKSSLDTFGSELRHFARSVDIVDDDIFDRVRQPIYKYVRNELDATYFELMREQPFDRETGLKTFWSSDERDNLWRLRQSDGSYTNLVALAFGEDHPLWIVGENGDTLRGANKLDDEWMHNPALLPYQPMADQAIRTLIVLPLRRKRPLGVCYLECTQSIGITDVAKTELQMLAEAIAILLELYETNRSQSSSTSSAIFELNEKLDAARFPRLTRPHFFIAHSNRADDAVKRVIFEVLDEFADKVEFTNWEKMSGSGNINVQIANDIVRSRFGICYLSEPSDTPDGGIRYIDNPNVVFEAGMVHARTAMDDPNDRGQPTGWIPLREVASPPAPFDFASERILLIPRLNDGKLNEERLRDSLRRRIDSLLGTG
jgi:hypothetical protein